MNAQEREQVRLSILRYCARPTSFGIVVQYLRSEGFKDVKHVEAALEIEYLVDKGFLVSEAKALSPEVKLWRTTANGRDYIAESLGV